MSGSIQPDQLVAAVLSDEVYHSEQELSDGTIVPVVINPPAGWELITSIPPFYDPTTGYYGEAWGKTTSTSGVYSEIMVVNRGTTFSQPGPDPFLPNVNELHDAWPAGNSIDPTGDLWQTVGADAAIVASLFTATLASAITDETAPTIVNSAIDFYNKVHLAFQSTPIIETGQSLGGALSDAVVAANVSAASSGALSAYTFNALAYSYDFTNLDSTDQTKVNAAVTNYYVGNEFFTQETPADWWIFSSPIGGTEPITIGDTTVGRVTLPDLVTNNPSVLDPITVHNPDAAVAALFQYLYESAPTAADVASAVSLLSSEYSNTLTRPATIQNIINTAASWPAAVGATPIVDNSQDTAIPNLDEWVTVEYGGNGGTGSVSAIATVPTNAVANIGSISVSPITPSSTSGAVSATQTDVYDNSGNLVAVAQTTAFSDGSYTVNHLDPSTRNVIETYSVAPDGTRDEQVFDSAGDIRTDVNVSPAAVVIDKQYIGDPTLLSNATINVGTGVVYSIVVESDQSVVTELDYGATATDPGTYVGLVDNPDGSADIVDGQGEDGTFGDIINFGSAGLADDTLSIAQATTGTIDITLDIEPGTVTDISSDHVLANILEGFAFTGPGEVMQIGTISDFVGTISGFSLGDTIDLAGISATGATLGAGNVLTVHKSGGGNVGLQLDPTQNFSGINFQAFPDGRGGTSIAPDSLVGLSGSTFSISSPSSDTAGTFSVIDPATGAVNASGASFPGTVLSEGGAAGNGNFYFEASGSTTHQLSLYTVDITTGAILDDVPTTDQDPFVADNLTGELVGMSGSMLSLSAPATSTAGTFSTIDPATGIVDAFGASFPGLQLVLGGAAVNGNFYFAAGVPGDGHLSLYTVDVKTGALLNQVPFTDEEPFVADNLTGELVGMTGSALSPSSPSMDTAGTFSVIDPTTGTINAFGASFPGLQLTSGGTAADGKFYFTAGNPITEQLYLCTVDIRTGGLLSEVPTTEQSFVADQPLALCFCGGTQIMTPAGEVPVERLSSGDEVVTLGGRPRRIVWIGKGRVLVTRGRRNAATPVIVRKGALGPNVPHRDLRVTKAHSLYIDDVLIPVEFLVNHRSIVWDDHAQEVTLYHIELDTHDVLLANGAPAESYRDDGNRWLFQNANSGWGLPAQEPFAPVLTGGPIVEAAWRRLLDRTGPRPGAPLTNDPDLHLMVDGKRMDAAPLCGDMLYVFRLAARPATVRIVSRTAIPAELGLARDPRSVGVALRRIVVREGTKFRTTEASDPRLSEGFHTFEPDNKFRWTDGDAAVPAELFSGFAGPLEFVLHLGATASYLDDGAAARRVA